MKSILLFAVIFILGNLFLHAQTNANWALTTNGNPSNTGYLTGSAISGGGGIGTISYGTNGAYSNNWATTTLAAAQIANDYYQYNCTATANVSITSISVSMMYNHPIGMSAAFFYSINGSAYVQAGTNFVVDQNITQFTAGGLNLSVLNGQTFSLRVYGWLANNNVKLFYNRGMVITGYWSDATDYFQSYADGTWNNINNWLSSPDSISWYHASLYPTGSAASVDIRNGNSLTLTAAATANNLNFTSGSITLGDNNLSIGGSLSGTPYFTYSGSGVPSQTGTESHVTVTTQTPTSLPDTLNTLTINPGAGNSVLLPNDVTTTNLTFTTGDLDLDGNTVTLAGKDFAITSASAELSALSVSLANTSNTWGGGVSIARTWTVSSAFTDSVDVSFTYPESESSATDLKVWRRELGDTGPWTLVGTYSTVDNGTTRTLTVTDQSLLNFTGGSWEWTLSELTETLPVELSSFTAVMTAQNYVLLEWVTQSETGVSGYYLFRSLTNNLSGAERINAFITATNTSQETSYVFTDREATPGYLWYYWLQNIDLDGNLDFHGPLRYMRPSM